MLRLCFLLLLSACESTTDPLLPDDVGTADGGSEPIDVGVADAGIDAVEVSATLLEFPDVPVGVRHDGKFTLHNPTDRALRVKIDPIPEPFALRADVPIGEHFTMPPGETREIGIDVIPEEPGDFYATIQIETCDEGCHQTVELVANGVYYRFGCSITQVDQIPAGTCADLYPSCNNYNAVPIRVTTATITGSSAYRITFFLAGGVGAFSGLGLAAEVCPPEAGRYVGTLQLSVEYPNGQHDDLAYRMTTTAR